jgi:hypothetical protein
MNHTRPTITTVEMHGYDGQHTIPSFHEKIADAVIPNFGEVEVTRSMVNPFVFHLIANDKANHGPNHGFIATINLSSCLVDAMEALPELIAAEDAEVDRTERMMDDAEVG